jgi:hypothetical protein
MHQFNEIVRIATATLVMFTVLSLASNLKQGKHLWAKCLLLIPVAGGC